MTAAERKARIESYHHAPTQLREALKKFPREMWKYKPSPDRWSIHEIIVHLADAEANSYIRCRVFVAEPGKTIMAYEQDLWATRLSYHNQSTEDALTLFGQLREMSYRLISTLPESIWTNTINHPEDGIVNFDKWLLTYEQHTPKHIEQMQRNYEAWEQSTPPR